MKINNKYIVLFILLFVLFLFWGLFIVDLYADEVWNYGFSYSIYNGLVPYKDFNMVIPPLFPFVNAFFFKLFGLNMLVFHIINSIILSIMGCIGYKMIKEKSLLCLLVLFLPVPNTFPSYNLFIVFLFIILIYLENNKKDDLLIGIILGLSILTKQSVGLCLLLPSIYYIKDLKKIIKRFIGIIIPISIFVIYLLFTKTVLEFLDLCLFGLFDFSKNGLGFNYIYILSFIYIVICFYMIHKDKKNINNYYALMMLSMTVPLFDLYHFQLSLYALLIVLFINYNIKLPINIKLLFIGIIIGVGFIHLNDKVQNKIFYPNDIKNFEYRFIGNEMIQYTHTMNEYLDKHKDRNIVYLTNNAYYVKISRNERLTKLDLINNGNHGYNSNKKLMNLIKEEKDSIFVVSMAELSEKTQTNKDIIKYVLKNGEKVDEITTYDIYVLNGEY